MSGALETLLAALCQAGLLSPDRAGDLDALVADGVLTAYQGDELREGRGHALLLDSYVLLDRIGEGGMGEVFRARHLVMHRDVALKRVHSRYLGTPAAVARFLREVRAASKLSHPNVVQVFDAGEAHGCHYLAMELLDGVDLSDHLWRQGPLSSSEAVQYVRQACVGMQHAHEQGLVHRDLKPANLMLCRSGVVKVMDLGLALIADAETVTNVGGTFGTVDYMAPEQVLDSHNVDVRADVYSLGCTLYHLLCGKTPFEEAHPAARPAMHVNADPTPLEDRRPGVPAGVAAVVAKMMAKRREDRHQTPGEAAAALAEVLGRPDDLERIEIPSTDPGPTLHTPAPVAAPPRLETAAVVPPQAQPPAARGSVAWTALVALAAVAALAAGYVAVNGWPEWEEPPTKEPPQRDARDDVVNPLGMRMVRLRPGAFVMGSPDAERGRSADEGPARRVEITREFWLCVTEVTQGQYRQLMGHNPSYFSLDGTKAPSGVYYDTSPPRGGRERVARLGREELDEWPVENVSWDDARLFLERLNARLENVRPRLTYRLPTEAEWEYACRAGTATAFAAGETYTSASGNFDGNYPYGEARVGLNLEKPRRVGAYEANAWGLHDMHGNVSEWVADRYGAKHYASGERADPKGPAEGAWRVARGGSWFSAGKDCRSASRSKFGPQARYSHRGFRVAAVR